TAKSRLWDKSDNIYCKKGIKMIQYEKGDLFEKIKIHQKDKHICIPHVCNDIGAWGSGFVVALSKFSRAPEEKYRKWHTTGYDQGILRLFNRGQTQIVAIT